MHRMNCGQAEAGDLKIAYEYAKPMLFDYYSVHKSDLPGLDLRYQRILIE